MPADVQALEVPKAVEERPASDQPSFVDAIEKLRSRNDIAAKALATLGTAVIGGVSLEALVDVFPYEGPDLALLGLFVGFSVAIVTLGVISREMFSAVRVVVMRSDHHRISDLDENGNERGLIEEVFADAVVMVDVNSLPAYEARAERLARVARRVPADVAAQLEKQVEEIRNAVLAAHARGAFVVLRHRTTSALSTAAGGSAVLLAGLALALVSADRLEAERSTDLQKSCAEAFAAGVVEADLPEFCPDVERPPAAEQGP